MEERGGEAGSGRAKDSVLVRAEGPGPEAGAGSVAAWKIQNPKSSLNLSFSLFRTFS